MMAILIWWFALPSLARRLMGAFLVLAAIAGAVLVYGHHREARGYTSGYVQARDSVWKREMQHRQVLLDSMKRRADSLVTIRKHGDSLLTVEASSVTKAIAARPTLRLEPLPDSFATVPRPDMVRVTVESTGEVFDVPRGAAQYWKTADSLVAVASALLEKYAAANRSWSEAWHAENEARIASDSLVARYAQQLRDTQATVDHPANASLASKTLRVAAWIGVGLVLRNVVHARL